MVLRSLHTYRRTRSRDVLASHCLLRVQKSSPPLGARILKTFHSALKRDPSERLTRARPLLAAPYGTLKMVQNGAPTLTPFDLYLEGYWELSEVLVLFSNLLMLYLDVVSFLSTFRSIYAR